MEVVGYNSFTERYLKALSEEEREKVVVFLNSLSEDQANRVIDTGLRFHKLSAVNGSWFWRTVPNLAEVLDENELDAWLEEGAGICRGSWECGLYYIKESPEVMGKLGRETFLKWLQIGRILVRFSNHETNWYLKNSGSILGKLDKQEQEMLISGVLNLMERSWTAAVACLKSWPEISRLQNSLDKEQVLATGLRIAGDKPDDAAAFFKALPGFLQAAGYENLAKLVDASYLITNGGRGVTGAFFTAAPGIAAKTVRAGFGDRVTEWSQMGNRLTMSDQRAAIEFFEMTPLALKNMDWRDLEKWVSLIENVIGRYSSEGALEFIRITPELLQQLDADELGDWVSYGLDNIHSGKRLAYFMLKSQESRDMISRLRSGLHLENVKKILVIYSEGLSGTTTPIRNTSVLPERIHNNHRLFGSLDTRRVYLPDMVRIFENDRENLRFYRVMLMHQLAHHRFGTMSLDREKIRELASNRYLGLLFEFVEDIRVDYLAMESFPGLGQDIKLLLQKETAGFDTPGIPDEVLLTLKWYLWLGKGKELPVKPPEEHTSDKGITGEARTAINEFWQKVLKGGASAEESLELARRLYRMTKTGDASGEGLGKTGNMAYRGCLRFDLLYTSMELDEEIDDSCHLEKPQNGAGDREEELKFEDGSYPVEGQETDLKDEFYLFLKKLLNRFYEDEENPYRMIAFYDEWDRTLNDYKKDWCRVREIQLKPSTGIFVDRTLEENYGMITTVKKYFGMLRPDRFRRYSRQDDGEDIDIDAIVEAMVEIKAGVSPDGGFYVRRDKRERDVAVGFLLDLSYSTDESVPETGKTLLDVEMESVIVMAEALEVLGDKYAIYGFNSDGRDKINFYVAKDFEEEYTEEVKQRFGGLQSYGMTRLASAVRHAVFKMQRVPAAVKILILLSDGRPFDFDYHSGLTDDYEEWYTETDTRMSLREAKMKGINPFCITVDAKGNEYLEFIFGNVSYIIIDDINALPTKLTETYKNLTT